MRECFYCGEISEDFDEDGYCGYCQQTHAEDDAPDHWSDQYDWKFFDWLQENIQGIDHGVAGQSQIAALNKAFQTVQEMNDDRHEAEDVGAAARRDVP